jgi:uncharacterized membrane protein
MVGANMAASIYAEPHAFSFRVASSFAAPIFITLAGMMIVAGRNAANHDWPHYLARGTSLLAAGAGVDLLIWKIVPFRAFDVLYLIGLACPITYFVARLARGWQLGIIALIFLATPILQWRFGYTDLPGDIPLWGGDAGPRPVPKHPTSVAQHLFIDGDFPLFPWLGMSLAGAVIAQEFFSDSGRRRLVWIALALLLSGIPAWVLYPGQQYVRDGYSELFYPPTVGFILTALGALLALLLAVGATSEWRIYQPLRWLGEAALLMYILHLAIIAYVLEPSLEELAFGRFLMVDLMTVLFLTGLAGAVHHLKRVWNERPYVLRFLLGG